MPLGTEADVCRFYAEFTANPTGDAVASVQGLISRLLGDDMVTKFSFEVIPATKGADGFGYDTFEFESAGTTL